MHLEVVLSRQYVGEFCDGARVERNGGAAPRADQVMAVDRGPGDIDGTSRTIENPRQHAERGQNLQRPIDRRATTLAGIAGRGDDELLGRKRPLLAQRGGNDGPAWAGHTVPMAGHGGDRLLGRVISRAASSGWRVASWGHRHARSVAFPSCPT